MPYHSLIVSNDRLEDVSEKFQTETPFLSLFTIPTLDSTSFDLDVELGNFFREVYKGKAGEERDVYLQTLDLGFDVRKQSTLLITPLAGAPNEPGSQYKYDMARPRPAEE